MTSQASPVGAACCTALPGTVDIHTHAMSAALPELEQAHPWGRWPSVRPEEGGAATLLVGGRPYRRIDESCWSATRRLSDMDADGVRLQVLSPIPITLCHEAPAAGAAVLAAAQNDFLAELVRADPERFRAFCAVPLQDPDAAVRELRRRMAVAGFVGVEIGTRVGDRELSDPAFDQFFAVAAELGAVVFVHPVDDVIDERVVGMGIAFGAGMPTETGLAAAGLLTSGALDRRPPARLCFAHAGGTLPWLLPRLDRGAVMADPEIAAERLPSSSARSFLSDSLTYDPESLRLAVARYGADHVMTGSDYPFPAQESPVGAVVDKLGLPGEVAAAIARGTATWLIGDIDSRRPVREAG